MNDIGSLFVTGGARPAVWRNSDLYQSSYQRGGLSHVTLAGARHHGINGMEVRNKRW